MTIGQLQKNAGPPSPIPTPKFPYEPVETLMNAKAIAKLDRNPRVRFSSGLMPRARSCASSRAATSWGLLDSATISSSYRRPTRARLTSGERRED